MHLGVVSAVSVLLVIALSFRPAAGALSSNSISLHPASIPIAVRSPYLSAWLDTLANVTTVPDELPPLNFWTPRGTLGVGWLGLIKVDGQTYQWMGVAGVAVVEVLEWVLTPTQTAFKLRAGPVDFTVTFLSPIQASDWASLSFPFSYLSIDIISQDGRDHEVQVYTDVTGEWVAPNSTESTFASTTRTASSVYYSMRNGNASSMAERSDMALDGTLILAAANTNAVTFQNGPSARVRSTFDQQRRLTNAEDSAEMRISPQFHVMALSIDLGTIRNTSSPTPAVFALGLVRDPVIEYHKDSSQTQTRRPYFFTKWATSQEAVDAFIADFPPALTGADELDTKIMKDARSSGTEGYADLVALSLRQTMASIEVTVPVTDGKPDAGDLKSFMKDIGETGRVNPLGTLYASLPALLYLNPSLVGTLLDPLLEAQALSSYPHAFAAPDLGSGYPKATRNETDTTALGVDSSSSMLIIALLHAKKSGEGALLKRYYSLFKKWADYLVAQSLRPTQSETPDGLTADGNANLALKGIMALHAMSKISEAVGETADVGLYSDTAKSYYSQWRTLGLVGGRVVSSYNQTGSWALAYNLYAAKLLEVDFVTSEVYDGQTAFHRSQLSSGGPYGIGYDSNEEYKVKSHWLLFTAATMTDNTVRDGFISAVHNRTFMDGINPPFVSTWNAGGGATIGGRASPAQGAMFALLALNVPDVPIRLEAGEGGDTGGSSPLGSSGKKTSIGAIVGGVVGGLAILLLLGLLFILRKRRNKRSQQQDAAEEKERKELVDHSDDSLAPLPASSAVQTLPRSSSPNPIPSQTSVGQSETLVSPTAPTVFVKSRLPPDSNQRNATVPLHSVDLTNAPLVSGSGGNATDSNAAIGAPPIIDTSKDQGPIFARQQQAAAGEGADDLRAEMLALRREMENLRAHQALSASRGGALDADERPMEPPPSYST
ncbi:hypothetical protein BKA70DRAFT_1564642 [Coprinopsis sp. MPI-PUGE-AT-0042]|nr:hypothetical protein BKA70DRAFT_1564642 [Coprinopsis sp. MPI-PUGE-AT-0042]